ncbi:hypothetical protein, partial [Limosilactobacillus mucosae]|uniref:hypothetical protein n=1 Tax=Limosilactobacillus mucosae TaxID=97478 RepID=UPI0022E50F73
TESVTFRLLGYHHLWRRCQELFYLKSLKIIQTNSSKMTLKILSVHQRDNDILLYRLNLLKSIAFLHYF